MRKIKIKEIVCIIGLLGTLTAHSQKYSLANRKQR